MTIVIPTRRCVAYADNRLLKCKNKNKTKRYRSLIDNIVKLMGAANDLLAAAIETEAVVTLSQTLVR